jgi:AGCS family alanine or glycine:cation symporter
MASIITTINDAVWGYVMLFMLIGTGVYLTIGLKFISLRKIGFAFKKLFEGRKSTEEGDISPFNALMTSLSATVGVGNIGGVAIAIGIGGPGALMWMWLTGLLGMATKFAEAVCAVKYREVDEDGRHVGGPMYYIRNGLGKNWAWLAMLFAIFCGFGGLGAGNSSQSNAINDAVEGIFGAKFQIMLFGVEVSVVGLIVMVLIGLVIIGGVKRIAHVAGAIVPFMAIAYLIACLCVLVMHFSAIPEALILILESAISPPAAVGGFSGSLFSQMVQKGVERGLFSNEAGQGSAPIAHAAAETKDPVQQGVIAMLGTFIDTLVICTMTGLVIVITGTWQSGLEGVAMTAAAFGSALPGGYYICMVAVIVFAFTTIIGWSYYSERCFEYMFGVKSIIWFRCMWVLAIPVGATIDLGIAADIAGIFNGAMAFPNLIALLLLSPVVFKLTNEYFNK